MIMDSQGAHSSVRVKEMQTDNFALAKNADLNDGDQRNGKCIEVFTFQLGFVI